MQPKLTVLTDRQWSVSEWSGGKTTQFVISPENAVYQSRDFLWRLSSATVELAQSDFTPLPDYTRLISVLKGGMQLFPEGGEAVTLAPYEVYSFDGATPVLSKGCCIDYNLMLRRDRCEGTLQALRMLPGRVYLSAAIPSPLRYQNRTVAVFCAEGAVCVGAAAQAFKSEAGQLVIAESLGATSLWLECVQESVLMIAQIEF